MTSTRQRLARQHRARFQRLPLPTWLRVSVITFGWLMILLGIAGLFLPILQGGLCLALGFALLSIGSQTLHLWFRGLMGRWPRIWRRLEKVRRKIYAKLRRLAGAGPDKPDPA
ncbi:MAG: hypothetical protein ABI639_06150 [Thermoanaerobaculia bacterium]